MGDTWVTDMRHFLDERGDLAAMPAPALKLALHLGSIVGWMTSRSIEGPERTNVSCRRSPGRVPCRGEIHALFEARGGAILWECPLCGDNGRIDGWQESRWDRRSPGAHGNGRG